MGAAGKQGEYGEKSGVLDGVIIGFLGRVFSEIKMLRLGWMIKVELGELRESRDYVVMGVYMTWGHGVEFSWSNSFFADLYLGMYQ